MFAKQLPKLLETLIPGLNMSGSLQLNPLKKVANEAMGGKFLAGAAVAGGVGVAGALAGGASKYRALRDTGHGIPESVLRGGLMGGIGGGLRSTGRTIMTGSDGSIGGTMKTMGNGFASAGHGAQNIYAKDGTSFGGRMTAGLQTRLGLETNADKWDKIAKNHENLEKQMNVLDKCSSNYVKKHPELTLSDGSIFAAEKKKRENILNGNTISDANIAARNEARNKIKDANAKLANANSTEAEKRRAMETVNKYSELANSYTAAEQVAAQTEMSKMEKEAEQLARIALLNDSTLDSEFNMAIDDILYNTDYSDLSGYDDIVKGIGEERRGLATSSIKDGRSSAKATVQRIPLASQVSRANKAYATRNRK